MGLAHPAERLRATRGGHLAGKRVALGVDGARGAPGAVRVARELLRLGAEVEPLLTPSAARWVHPDALAYATGRAPRTWPGEQSFDAVLLAPLGPEGLRKLRLGLADSAPLAAALAARGLAPVLVAPAPGLQAGGLEALGFHVLPGSFDAHGEPRPETLAARVAGLLSGSGLRGRAALLVAGGAREPWDAMRAVAAPAGEGVALALRLELERRGARVRALLGPWAWPAPGGGAAGLWEALGGWQGYESARDLIALAEGGPPVDVALVEDALPRLAPAPQRGKVASGQQGLALELGPAPDAVAALRARARALVAFRAAGSASPWLEAVRVAREAEEALA